MYDLLFDILQVLNSAQSTQSSIREVTRVVVIRTASHGTINPFFIRRAKTRDTLVHEVTGNGAQPWEKDGKKMGRGWKKCRRMTNNIFCLALRGDH